MHACTIVSLCCASQLGIFNPDAYGGLQVGHVLEQRQSWNRPEDVTEFRGVGADVGIMRLEESPSDLAGQVVAAITAGALALQQYGEIDRNVAQTMVRMPPVPCRACRFAPHAPIRMWGPLRMHREA